MHILLTGDIQVGKSTIIRKLITRLSLSADGFLTYWEPGENGSRSLYLSPYSTDMQSVERHMIAHDDGKDFRKNENIAEVFDTHGVGILGSSGNRDIIVMDELGFLESRAFSFQESVLRRLSGDVPVLGVIKPMQSEFLDAVRAHHGVTVFDVTLENRDTVFAHLTRLKSSSQ